MLSIELFAGCGGLAMGLSRAGFRPKQMVEWDRHSVVNITHNRQRGVDHVASWPIHHQDVRSVQWQQFSPLDLVAGGPPCQPFSIGGRHKGDEDGRDMWPEAVRAVRETMPRGFLFENVRGLTREAFSDYLEWICTSLAMPRIERADSETRESHLNRMRGSEGPADYLVSVTKVNAADFGAAQKRHRVIILGVRRDISSSVPSLNATHSKDRLLWDQWITGDYWVRHGIVQPPKPPATDVAAVKRLMSKGSVPPELPWRTVRDAIAGLGEPGANSTSVANHDFQPGARSYPGHTGSPIDMPAKALKAGVHGVPGGENTLASPDGSVRYFSVREAARLQGMPDNYEFVGSWSENMRQLGNAVPTQLAEAAARAISSALVGRTDKSREQYS